MATKDFSAKQIRASQLLASGGISGTTVGLAIYSASDASDLQGGFSDASMFSNVGSDVLFFVSGSANQKSSVSLFRGDVVISGTLYAERQVIEVDETTTGSLLISGSLTVSQSATINEGLTVNSSGESGSENDFRVETSTLQGAIVVDASHEIVMLGSNEINAPGESLGSDVNLFFSGSAGTKNTAQKGTSVFAGDVVISGSLYDGSGAVIGGGGGSTTGSFNVPTPSNFVTTASVSLAGGEGFSYVAADAVGTDIYFFVSGTDGGKGTEGTSLFGGDVVVSGAFYPGGYEDVKITASSTAMTLDSNQILNAAGESQVNLLVNLRNALQANTSGVVINTNGRSDLNFRVASDNKDNAVYVDAASDQVLILSGGAASDTNESNYTDMNLFVSGAIGSKDTSTRGTSVFGGDVVISGTLYPGGNSDQFISANGAEMIIDGNNHVDVRMDSSFGVYSAAGGTSNPIFAVYSNNGTVVNTNGLLYQDFRVESDNKEGAILLDSQTEQLALLVNATTAATAYDGAPIPSDIDLYVSGAVGGKGTEGTSVFGGDVVISGSLHGGSPLQIGEYQSDLGSDVALFVSGTSGEGGGKGSTNGATVIGSDLIVSGAYRGGYDGLAGFETFQAVSEQYLLLSDDSDFGLDQLTALDTNFFVSGSIGSKDSETVKGTAVFGGDLHVSGAITADGGAPAPTYRYHYQNASHGNYICKRESGASSGCYMSMRFDDGAFNQANNGIMFVCPASGSIERLVLTPSSHDANPASAVDDYFFSGDEVVFFATKNERLTCATYVGGAATRSPQLHCTSSDSNLVSYNFENTLGSGNVNKVIMNLGDNQPFVSGSNQFDPGDVLIFGAFLKSRSGTGSGDVDKLTVQIVFKLDESVTYP